MRPIHPHLSLLRSALFVVLAPTVQGASAQPIELDPALVLQELYAAYRAGPVADEVLVTIRAGGQERQETIRVSLQARRIQPPTEPRFLLDLGRLRLSAIPGLAVAAQPSDSTTCVAWPFEGDPTPDDLARVLPPLPLPQLAIAFGRDDALASPTPYTPGVTWTSASATDAGAHPTSTLVGHSAAGPITMTMDARTGRLRELVAELASDPQPVTIELACRAIDPGDPGAWPIDPAGRERLASLADLGRPRPLITPGRPIPDLPISTLDGTEWSFPESAAPTLILFFRVPADADRAAAIDLRVQTVMRALAGFAEPVASGASPAGAPPAQPESIIVVAVFRLPDATRERLDALPARRPVPLFTTAASATIDRFAPGADAALVVMDPDRTLRAAVPLDGRDPASVAAEIDTLLK